MRLVRVAAQLSAVSPIFVESYYPGGAASEKDPGITCQLDDKGRARMTAGVQNQSDAIEDAKEHTLHRSDLTACHMDDLTSSCKFNKSGSALRSD
ncbi:hypothetical protein FQA47_000751 [Oryzias melastigma]|uniref:Uncharacterized protein n=1 Tax=Oryzias melastigma TaxID=30732 RepID=A0A834CQ34_ORYME|nr:hypothetical protein FQA47_000751 [Oryzias melastigma]